MKIAVTTPVRHLKEVFELLNTKGEIFLYEESNKSEVREGLLKNSIDTILCNPNQQTYKIDQELLEGTNVKIVNTCSTGLNHIDIDYCKRSNIKIYSLTKDYDLIEQLPSTAELAFGLLLDLMRNITLSNNNVKRDKIWEYTPYIGHQVKDFKIGIVGYGRLGKMMARYCKAFDAEVFIYDPYKKESNVSSLENLFDICDAVSIHVHVTPETKSMITYDLLTRNVKYLVNTSRGEIVNELDIIQALKEKRLLGYGTDVIVDEFGNIQNSVFFKEENNYLNVIITPHIGGMTIEGQTKAYKWAINKL
jgi:D-3-phosphoglycerate dehydrogenase